MLSGVAAPERASQALDSLYTHLVRKDAKLIQLLDPPFDRSNLDPGYIRGYVPGVRENGGQYTHAAIWATMAFAELGDSQRAWELFNIINPVNHGNSAAAVALYKAEPYVVAADGRTLYSTDPGLKPIDIRDREYFKALEAGREDYVSSLLISRLSGDQIFVFSRRFEEAGVFAGVVTVSLSTELMKPIWEAVNLGGNFAVSFIRDDGQLVARYPKPEAGLDMSGYVLFTDYLKRAPTGTYMAEASPLDGVQRIVGYRKVEGTPFVAVAAADLDRMTRDLDALGEPESQSS